MMFAPTDAAWNAFIGELFSISTMLYLIGTVAFFAVIILVLEFLDSTSGRDK